MYQEFCRVCNGTLEDVLDLGELHPSGFLKPGEPWPKKSPLILAECYDCGLVQLRHTVSLDSMYRQYWYRSGLNSSMVADLKDVVQSVEKEVSLEDSDVVLDIGCNDGTLFDFYTDKDHIIKIGYDPALNLSEEAKHHCNHFVNDYFSADFILGNFGPNSVKVITAIAMFYDLPDPNWFLQEILKVLHPAGIFVIQFTDLLSMMKTNAFDNVCFPANTFIAGANKNIEDIKTGDLVFGKTGQLESVTSLFRRTYQGNLIEISARYLESITCTPDHPILVLPKENYKFPQGQLKPNIILEPNWAPAKDLSVGDAVAIPRIKNIFHEPLLDLIPYNKQNSNWRRGLTSVKLNEGLAWILGLYTAEGFTSGKENNLVINFALHEDETDYIDRISKFFKSLNYKTRVYPYKNNKAVNVQISCTALARAFTDWVGRGARNKYIPDFIMQSENNLRIAYLKGLISGDGWIDSNNKVELHTASHTLALQTQLLFASLGTMVGICHIKADTRSKLDGTEISGGDSWLVRGTSKEISSIFELDHRHNQRQLYFVTDDFIFVPIQDIKILQEESLDVFNLETEITHTYTASNIVVHNCHEHLEYYYLKALKYLLEKNHLEIFHVEYNKVNGGSLRVYVQFAETSYAVMGSVQDALDAEEAYMNSFDDPMQSFALRVENICNDITTWIREQNRQGKRTYVLGASTKGSTLLQYFNLDNTHLPYAAEINSDKFGLVTVGTGIPIISEKEAEELYPDAYIVLPWHFTSTWEKFLLKVNRDVSLLLPLPEPHLMYLEDGTIRIRTLE